LRKTTVNFAQVSAAAPLIVVPVRVNGVGRLRFLLDTGASHSCVTPRLVKRLGLTAHGDAMALGAGGELKLSLARIDSLSVGKATVKSLTVAIVDIDHVAKLVKKVDGVLGNDFMRRFVVTLDYKKGKATFA
jgi:predicted aspartyl protease